MNKRELKHISDFSATSFAELYKGERITTDVLPKIRKALDCNLSDNIEISETRRNGNNARHQIMKLKGVAFYERRF